jgi:tetratricopeptide (TPR) repeat protein
VLHFSAGRTADAVADLDEAIALTDTAALRVNRAIAHEALGDTQAAIRDYDAALSMPDADVEDVTSRRAKLATARGEGD